MTSTLAGSMETDCSRETLSSSWDRKRDSTSLRTELSGGHAESRKPARAPGSNSSAVCKTSLTLCHSSGVILCLSNGHREASPPIAILRTPLWLLSEWEYRDRRLSTK